MLGIQLNLDGDCFAVCNGVVIGKLKDKGSDDDLGVLRILNNEYSEQVRLIKSNLLAHKDELEWFNSVQLWSGELVVGVKYDPMNFKEIVEKCCYPMKVENLIVTYVHCRKAYVVKQSAVYIKYELKRLGVIE